MAGDARGRVFTFPIPTYNITPDFPWESDNAERLFALTAKYGLPYFQNFLNSELKPNMIRSMCCRLQLDLTEAACRWLSQPAYSWCRGPLRRDRPCCERALEAPRNSVVSGWGHDRTA